MEHKVISIRPFIDAENFELTAKKHEEQINTAP